MHIPLPTDEVHLWSFQVEVLGRMQTRLYEVLSSDERERSERFRYPSDRQRFALSRSMLRVILARYTNTQPRAIRFGYTRYGKPVFENSPVFFNISHSKNIVVMAFCREPMIGVDAEGIETVNDVENLAPYVLAPREHEELLSLAPELRLEAFISCWTRKEAYSKAIGCGLGIPFQQFEVTLSPDLQPQLLLVHQGGSHAAEWSMFSWRPAPSYFAAAAVRGPGYRFIHKSDKVALELASET